MPDVVILPAIASFFGVSKEELFDFNRLDTEKQVYDIAWAAADKHVDEPCEAEKILCEGLKNIRATTDCSIICCTCRSG